MSRENLERFAQRVLEDPDLQARILATGEEESYVKLVLEEAAGFTTEELLEMAREGTEFKRQQGLRPEEFSPEFSAA